MNEIAELAKGGRATVPDASGVFCARDAGDYMGAWITGTGARSPFILCLMSKRSYTPTFRQRQGPRTLAGCKSRSSPPNVFIHRPVTNVTSSYFFSTIRLLFGTVWKDFLIDRSSPMAPAAPNPQPAVRRNVPPLGDWYLLPTVKPPYRTTGLLLRSEQEHLACRLPRPMGEMLGRRLRRACPRHRQRNHPRATERRSLGRFHGPNSRQCLRPAPQDIAGPTRLSV